MKELQKEYIGKGETRSFTFRQIVAGKQAYIYEVSDAGKTWYEVFERKENKRFDIVSYPGSPSFGLWAWCIFGLEKAKRKFAALENKVKHSQI